MKYSIVLVIATSLASGSIFEKLRGLAHELRDYDQTRYNQGYLSDGKSKQYEKYNKPTQSEEINNNEEKSSQVGNYDNQNDDSKKNSPDYKNDDKYKLDGQGYNIEDKSEYNTQDYINLIAILKEYVDSAGKKQESETGKQADGQVSVVNSSQPNYGSSHGQHNRNKKLGRKNHKNHSHVPNNGYKKGSREINNRKSHSHKSNNGSGSAKYGGCTEGQMFCNKYNVGIFTCSNDHYVLRDCGPGTQCQQSGQNVFCNTASISDNYYQSSKEVDQDNNDEGTTYIY